MRAVVGIDAAWTAGEPSGVALVADGPAGWRCVAAAPSYRAFVELANGIGIDWSRPALARSEPSVHELLVSAEHLAKCSIDVAAVDMPIATVPFASRRAADSAISREFGARWCSAHSPNASRPGPLGARFSAAFQAAGFELATKATRTRAAPALVEVYPHPALLSLLKRDKRVPYKVSKASKYWPDQTGAARNFNLLSEFGAIYSALSAVFGSLPFELPDRNVPLASRQSLKRYEDTLDSLVCAWVGVEFLEGRTVGLGDETAAIWCPADVVRAPANVR